MSATLQKRIDAARLWYATHPVVRPWAVAVPVLVLLLCLPLLRPLRHPDPGQVSHIETLHVLSAVAWVETGSMAVAKSELAKHATLTIRTEQGALVESELKWANDIWLVESASGKAFANVPPMLTVLLACAYWPMHRFGLSYAENVTLVSYILTLLFSTIPVAATAGVVYRLGRLFELRRERRTLLAFLAVFASGLISQATFINPLAPAAFFLLLAAAFVLQPALRPGHAAAALAWTDPARPKQSSRLSVRHLLLAGFFASVAACLHPAITLPALALSALVFNPQPNASNSPTSRLWKSSAFVVFLIGALLPLTADTLLSAPGGVRLVLKQSATDSMTALDNTDPTTAVSLQLRDDPISEEVGLIEPSSLLKSLVAPLGSMAGVVAGPFGLLSHYPLVVAAVAGCVIVLRKHWPGVSKTLAGVSLGGLIYLLGLGAWGTSAYPLEQPFGPALLPILPLLFVLLAPLLRSRWRPVWTIVLSMITLFCTSLGLLGAMHPTPPGGYSFYPPAEVMMRR